ncbi:hypothetical protein XA68_17106 [Ophiocordyceps unilateralis]|uniref:BTB domain-containing protein n=1 Tax=Ophiocordyceps unilateralis TaxID=268505 RepID=A0A2A9PJH3_OPHUN|nr:hypothetical protein XA68_17106 [Ophiocordyceps unilateralis]
MVFEAVASLPPRGFDGRWGPQKGSPKRLFPLFVHAGSCWGVPLVYSSAASCGHGVTTQPSCSRTATQQVWIPHPVSQAVQRCSIGHCKLRPASSPDSTSSCRLPLLLLPLSSPTNLSLRRGPQSFPEKLIILLLRQEDHGSSPGPSDDSLCGDHTLLIPLPPFWRPRRFAIRGFTLDLAWLGFRISVSVAMFKRSFRSQDQNRVGKAKKPAPARDQTRLLRLQRSLSGLDLSQSQPSTSSSIVTLAVGRHARLFAAHEDVLRQSPLLGAACHGGFSSDGRTPTMTLPDEEPDIFSAVLEYLYKGDYYPRLLHNKRRNSWELEDDAGTTHAPPSPDIEGGRAGAACVYLSGLDAAVLRDTVIYCAAHRYGLDQLKRLALRKQGLQSGIDVGTILRSAQYAYAHTPDTDSRLRAHYLALIIRCRKTFKRSGTMQAEMEAGGSKLFFDLFVAMCNHLDDVIDAKSVRTPRTV